MKKNVQIIAEIGVNHNGDYDLALKMIDAAYHAGADTVKFQTSIPRLGLSKYGRKAEYQLSVTDEDESFLEMCEKIHLPLESYIDLKKYTEALGVKFLSTPFDVVSIKHLDSIGVDCFKIPSGEIRDVIYLREIGKLGKNIILSTGMAELFEIKDALDVLFKAGLTKDRLTILHCNTAYPTPYEDVNLRAMETIREEFGVDVGYSDHTLGIEVAVAAVTLGATVIEKHFTLNRNSPGPDHQASLEPIQFKAMVDAIRNIELSLGDGVKQPSASEKKNIPIARKSIVAGVDIKKGELFSSDNLMIKRPGTGVCPMKWDELIGTVAKKDYKEDELIEL